MRPGAAGSSSSATTVHVMRDRPWTAGRYATIGGFILLYYAISVGLSVFNTQVLGRNRMNFPFPLFAALSYDIIQFTLSFAIMSALAISNPEAVGPVTAYQQLGASKFWKVILPCAVAAGLDIALSNCSLKYVSLAFYTMVKSSSPMFILIFAFVFRLERLSWSMAMIIGVIGLGTVLTVYNPTSFDAFGFVLVFSAAIMSGIRWALTQLIIEIQVAEDRRARTADGPLSAILFLTPPIGVTLAVLCQAFEGFPTIVAGHLMGSMDNLLTTIGVCGIGGVLTFSLILTEYKVVENTSVVTLSISGIVKEILMIAISVLYFKDTLQPINYLGLAVSIAGIMWYNLHKMRTPKRGLKQPDMYLAIPTTEPNDIFINPFVDEEEEEDYLEDGDVSSYIELEERRSRTTSGFFSMSRESVRSGKSIAPDAEEYFQEMKRQWGDLPSLEHYPVPQQDTADRSSGVQV